MANCLGHEDLVICNHCQSPASSLSWEAIFLRLHLTLIQIILVTRLNTANSWTRASLLGVSIWLQNGNPPVIMAFFATTVSSQKLYSYLF